MNEFLDDDLNEIWLRDFVDFSEIGEDLAKKLDIEDVNRVQQGFKEFFHSCEQSDYWYYTEEQCKKEIEILKKEFLEVELNLQKHGYVWQEDPDRIARELAQATGLDLIDALPVVTIYGDSWIK
jgi:hypothetical protein